ncbi:MAG: ABC transporter ATP-binding protein [Actinobacteria bacterium]|nr:ABC transporter ATP-binding protein [Actinomycetota bacterium]
MLRTEGLTKKFGDITAVSNLSLEIYEGEILGLLGPNGAGKTTSINMACGLLKPDKGQVYIQDQPIDGDTSNVSVRVGICPQSIVLWNKLTCLEQLEFIGEMYGISRKEARRRGEALLGEMALTDKRNELAKNLSGGMQRRLNIIMALVHDPGILVLDEPEAGLDPQSRVLVRDYIKSLAKKKTVIVTTHNMDEADRIADRVAIIDHGTLLTVNSPEALKQRLGEGDVLEIELIEKQSKAVQHVVTEISKVVPGVALISNSIVVRSHHAIEVISLILDKLKANNIKPGEIRLHENTLEDVFISLTGRSLRE